MDQNTQWVVDGETPKSSNLDGQEFTANPKQAPISPMKKGADPDAIVNKVNEIIAVLKMANIVQNKETDK